MKPSDVHKRSLDALKRYAKKSAIPRRRRAKAHGDHAPQALTSVRKSEHAGHVIEIRTHYDIRVDGRPLRGHFTVDNTGRVSCHALPTYSSPSAIELVKQIIDSVPDEFSRRRRRRARRVR